MNTLPKKVATTISLERVLLDAARDCAKHRGSSFSAFLESIIAERLFVPDPETMEACENGELCDGPVARSCGAIKKR